MQVMGSSLGSLAVAVIYYGYRDWSTKQYQRACTLRERVTYLLWATSQAM
jgi:hypothetical protein